jgi:hypothetical protein
MATIQVLTGWDVHVERSATPRGDNGDTVVTTSLVYVERGTNNVIRFDMGEDTRQALVGMLTGGIQIPGVQLK